MEHDYEWRKFTILPPDRLLTLVDEALRIKGYTIPGDIAEVGTYQGGSSLLLRYLLKYKRNIYAFDTFTGIPDVQPIDVHRAGDFPGGDEAYVRLMKAGVLVWRGRFPDSVVAKPLPDGTVFVLAHYDADTYQCCKDFIAYFKPKMVKGGVMIFDDYDWPRCPGVKRALDESGLKVEKCANYQALVRF